MLGTFAVGKSSLVRRYVRGEYDDAYLTTMGAQIEKKRVDLGDMKVDLVVWDLNGEDRFQDLFLGYLHGAAGYLLVVDATRKPSLELAYNLQRKVEREVGSLPFVTLINKVDLANPWEDQPADIEALQQRGWDIRMTSAKTGTGVDKAFESLARRVAVE